jgi:hypothetical protein
MDSQAARAGTTNAHPKTNLYPVLLHAITGVGTYADNLSWHQLL